MKIFIRARIAFDEAFKINLISRISLASADVLRNNQFLVRLSPPTDYSHIGSSNSP